MTTDLKSKGQLIQMCLKSRLQNRDGGGTSNI